jgi:hypothetical protein
MKRKKFFSAFGIGMLGILITKFSPLKLLNKFTKENKHIKVRINPLAVKRQKIGGKNV